MEVVEKIQSLLKKDPHKQLVFYFDEQALDGSFLEELEAIKAAGIEVVEVSDHYFKLKYKLEIERKNQPAFVYHPYPKPEKEQLKKYPLLDLLLANHELRLDIASEFVTDYDLKEYQLPLVKRYIKQLKSKSNQKKLAPILDAAHFTEENLKWGLISIALDANAVTNRNICIAKWLTLALDSKAYEKAVKSLQANGLEKELIDWINLIFDTNGTTLNHAFATNTASVVKYNILTLQIDTPKQNDNYARLKINHKPTLNRLHAFFNEWNSHPQLRIAIEKVFDVLAAEINSSTLLKVYGSTSAFGYYSSTMLSDIILTLYQAVDENPVKVREDCQKWMQSAGLTEVQGNHIYFLYHSAQILSMLDAYTDFRFNNPEAYIRIYSTELYLVDTHFRKAVNIFGKLNDDLDIFQEATTNLFDRLNQRYNKFLKDFNVEWQKMLQEKHFNLKEIDVNKQFDFYKRNLQKFEYKIVVIISDAFRYELGQELYQELITDTKNTVHIEPYLASIPSYTNLGMTNLLPHESVTIEKGDRDLILKINGYTTDHGRRADVMHEFEKDSSTINYSDVMQFNQEAGRKYFSDNRIVYVYHDWVDAIGDKKKTERQTFEAAGQAQEELMKLIKKLFAWNVYHILITADHGFIYNHTTITEASREVPPKATGYQHQHTRFMIADEFEGKVDGYLMDMRNTTHLDTDLKIALPRAINRYRIQGNIGLQFAHGGAAMQELLIPVIKLYRQKKETSQVVGFKRIDDTKKILSGSIKVTIIQDQPVSNTYKPLELIIGLYDENGDLYSNEASLILDSTSGAPKDRIFESILSLNPKGTKANFCYLRAFEKADKNRLNPLVINDLLQITTLMEKDF